MEEFWKEIKHFKPTERLETTSPVLIRILDAYRDKLGIPIFVSRGTDPPGTHDAVNSAHYPDEKGIGYAVDIIPLRQGTSIKLLDCFLLATKYPFSGIGIYPYWLYTGGGENAEKGGLHLDTSHTRKFHQLQSSGHWLGYPGKEGQKYEAISLDSLTRHGCLRF